MNAGIVVYNWKVPTFKKFLEINGFSVSDAESLFPDTSILIVEYNDDTLLLLKNTLESAQKECRN